MTTPAHSVLLRASTAHSRPSSTLRTHLHRSALLRLPRRSTPRITCLWTSSRLLSPACSSLLTTHMRRLDREMQQMGRRCRRRWTLSLCPLEAWILSWIWVDMGRRSSSLQLCSRTRSRRRWTFSRYVTLTYLITDIDTHTRVCLSNLRTSTEYRRRTCNSSNNNNNSHSPNSGPSLPQVSNPVL